jgi:NADH-quinone oxidoreductase chain G
VIKVSINGREIELEKPLTALEAAKLAGVKIPTLCFFDGLPPFGGCRLCVVEVEKLPKLQTACTLKVADGMVISTETEQVRAARRAMLEFLCINHALECPYCDKAGECELQDLVAQYGPEAGRFAEGKRKHPASFDDPIIVTNMERCILCTRCVRMCSELQGAHAITVTGRGGQSFIKPFSGGTFNCEYCGNCLSACPVGALLSRLHRHSYRPWFIERDIETTCGFCGVGCTLALQMRENSIVRTIPRFGLGLNNGLLCVRGRFGYDYVENKGRLSTPLLRKNGDLKPVSWEEALTFVSTRLKDIKDNNGGASVGAIASGRCTNEDNYMLQKLMRCVVGSNNIDSSARLYFAPAESYLERIFGQGCTANLIPGIANSDGVFVVGGDPSAINPILGLQIRASWKGGGTVVTLGSSGGLKRYVNYELLPQPYTEEIILSAIVDRLKKAKELSGESGFIEDKLSSMGVPPDEELVVAGLTPEIISRVCDDLSRMETPVVVIGPEIIQRRRSSKNLFLISAIAYLINARIFLLSEKPNYQGLIDMGCLPDTLPGGRPLEFDMFRHKMEETLGCTLPVEKGLTLFEMLNESERGGLRALYVMGENPLFSVPDRKTVDQALSRLDLLIVQDIYLTETARMADVVLPANSWSEKDGTFTNLERRVQRVRKGKLSSDGRDDWSILADIAQRMGMKETYGRIEDLWEEIIHVSPLHAGLGYEDIAKGKSIWPYQGEPLRGVEGDFVVEGLEELGEPPSQDESFLMLERPLYHSGTLSRRSKALLSIYPEPYAIMNPSASASLGMEDGGMVTVKTGGWSLDLKVKFSRDIPERFVFLSNTFEGAHFMGFVGYSVDPVTGACCLENNAVKLKKA